MGISNTPKHPLRRLSSTRTRRLRLIATIIGIMSIVATISVTNAPLASSHEVEGTPVVNCAEETVTVSFVYFPAGPNDVDFQADDGPVVTKTVNGPTDSVVLTFEELALNPSVNPEPTLHVSWSADGGGSPDFVLDLNDCVPQPSATVLNVSRLCASPDIVEADVTLTNVVPGRYFLAVQNSTSDESFVGDGIVADGTYNVTFTTTVPGDESATLIWRLFEINSSVEVTHGTLELPAVSDCPPPPTPEASVNAERDCSAVDVVTVEVTLENVVTAHYSIVYGVHDSIVQVHLSTEPIGDGTYTFQIITDVPANESATLEYTVVMDDEAAIASGSFEIKALDCPVTPPPTNPPPTEPPPPPTTQAPPTTAPATPAAPVVVIEPSFTG